MDYEVEGARPRGKPKKTWTEIVQKDCQTCKLNREDAMDHIKWRNQSINVKFVGCSYMTCPGVLTVVSSKHDQKVHF